MQEQMICIRFCSSATIESMSNLTDWSEITFERIPTTSTFLEGVVVGADIGISSSDSSIWSVSFNRGKCTFIILKKESISSLLKSTNLSPFESSAESILPNKKKHRILRLDVDELLVGPSRQIHHYPYRIQGKGNLCQKILLCQI